MYQMNINHITKSTSYIYNDTKLAFRNSEMDDKWQFKLSKYMKMVEKTKN